MPDPNTNRVLPAVVLTGTALTAAIGAAIELASPLTQVSEGEVRTAYVDRLSTVRPVTICFGHTGPDVRLGQRATRAECVFLLETDQRETAAGIHRCTPRLAGDVYAFAAVVDFAHNLGVEAYCRSTAAWIFNTTGNVRAGCEALRPYVNAGHRVRPGLVTRRRRDISLCITGRWQ